MSASDTVAAVVGAACSGDMTALNKTMEAAAMKHAVSEAALTKMSGRIDSIFLRCLPGAGLCGPRAARSSGHFSSSTTYFGGSEGGGAWAVACPTPQRGG